MKYTIIIFIITLNCIAAKGQSSQMTTPQQYNILIIKADSLYKLNEFESAALEYSKAFESTGGKGKIKDRYNAACCWSLIENRDSAFYQLNRIAIQGKYTNHEEILSEKHFLFLHSDNRWKSLIETIKQNWKDFEEASKRN
jgi:hypothetical protein